MLVEKNSLSAPTSDNVKRSSALEASAYDHMKEIPELKVSDERWDVQLLCAGLICSLSSIIYGYNIGDISGPKSLFDACNTDGSPNLYDDPFPECIEVGDYWGLVVAALCLGGLIGALYTGSFTKRFGRKSVLIFHNIFYISGTICMSMGVHVVMLIFGRFLLGIGSGICTVVVPMYLSEIATNKTRGTMGMMHGTGIVIGILIAQCIALFMIDILEMWRLFFGIVAGLSVLQMTLVIFFVNESPKYLLSKAANDVEPEKIPRKLSDKENIDEEFQPLAISKDSIAAVVTMTATTTTNNNMSVFQLIKNRAAQKSLIVGLTYHAAQQFSGINIVFYFGNTVMKACNLQPGIVVAMVGLVNVIMTGVSIWLMDKAGRRPLILVSSAGMSISCICMMISSLNSWNVANVVFVLSFVASFAVGIGPVPWVINGDIFPYEALDAGTSLTTGMNWVANTTIALVGEPLFKLLTADFLFLPFAIICALFFIFSFIFVPETKGKQAGFL